MRVLRQAARDEGKAAYFTGKPCRRGHIAERRVANGMCSACQEEWRLASPERSRAYAQRYRDNNAPTIRARGNAIYKADRTSRPWRNPIMSARDRAHDKGVEFALTSAWGASVWTGVCALTGLPFDLTHTAGFNQPFSPSIDRIRPADGYVPNNCRFVLSAVNTFRGLMSDEQMLRVCEALLSGPSAGTIKGASA
jgi:hypothetical protein